MGSFLLNSVLKFRIVLKLVRKERNLTQMVIAERCNLSVNYIGKIERGISIPTFEVFISLCNGLEVKMTDFAKKMEDLNYICESIYFLDLSSLKNKIKISRFFLCNFLLNVRKDNGITQINFAREIHIDMTYYGFIERGVSNPTIGKIFNICNSVNISFYDLLLYIENNCI